MKRKVCDFWKQVSHYASNSVYAEELLERLHVPLQQQLVETNRLGHLANGTIQALELLRVYVRFEEGLKHGR